MTATSTVSMAENMAESVTETPTAIPAAYPHLKGNVDWLRDHGQQIYAWLSSQTWDQEALKHNLVKNEHGILDWRIGEI